MQSDFQNYHDFVTEADVDGLSERDKKLKLLFEIAQAMYSSGFASLEYFESDLMKLPAIFQEVGLNELSRLFEQFIQPLRELPVAEYGDALDAYSDECIDSYDDRYAECSKDLYERCREYWMKQDQ